MSSNLTLNSPFYKRFLAWSGERFPFANILSGALSYITMVCVGKYYSIIELFIKPLEGMNLHKISLEFTDILGAVAFIGHLFLLRVYDEHKDYEIDLKNHPDRALSRGLITLKHLRLLALPLPFFAIYWSYLADNGSFGITSFLWLIMFIYSALMAKEFFIGKWLSKRLVLYSFSHMLVSPLMILWIIVGGAGKLDLSFPIIIMLILSFTGGIAYEITRKTRGTDESKELDSYNEYFGVKGCISIITGMNFVSFLGALVFLLLLPKQIGMIPYTILILGYTCTFYPTINFLKKQSEKARKINEAGIGLFFLGLYICIITALFI